MFDQAGERLRGVSERLEPTLLTEPDLGSNACSPSCAGVAPACAISEAVSRLRTPRQHLKKPDHHNVSVGLSRQGGLALPLRRT